MRTWMLVLLVFLTETVSAQTSSSKSLRQEGFYFTNPLLDCVDRVVYQPPFQKQVENQIKTLVKDGNAQRISVYFRQLNTGYAFSINDDEKFAPASMLKVGDLIYILQTVDEKKASLTDSVFYEGNFQYSQTNKRTGTLGSNQWVTVERLLRDMIILSDNLSVEILEKYTGKTAAWRDVMLDMGISIPMSIGRINVISAKEYASLFQILYNCTYLSTELSDWALRLLSSTTFVKGIVRGVGEDLIVANKYGLRNTPNSFQLHETAIVYLEGNPYLIAIMTEGQSAEDLANCISSIAKTVHSNCKQAVSNTSNENSNIPLDRFKTNEGLTHPLIDCGGEIDRSGPVSASLNKLVSAKLEEMELSNAAVYYRNLETGKEVVLNSETTFIPGQMSKVPVIMAILKLAERNPAILDRKLTINISESKNPLYTKLKPTMSVKELLFQSIHESDDNAYETICAQLPQLYPELNRLFRKLGIDQWYSPDGPISGKVRLSEIALLFNVLYNSTYLNRKNSEYVLSILAQSKLSVGMQKGLRLGIISSIQFGETVVDDGKTKYLVEGGIIYTEKFPFILIIGTIGKSLKDQSELINLTTEDVVKNALLE